MYFNNMAPQVFAYILLVLSLHSNFGSSHKIQSNMKFLKPLSGVQKGDNVTGVDELKKYLTYLDYLSYNNNNSHNNKNNINVFDNSLELALKRYQRCNNLNTTGVVDTNTIGKMHDANIVRSFYKVEKKNSNTSFVMASHYAFYDGKPKWKKRKLKYGFVGSIIKKEMKDAIEQIEYAIRDWAAATRPYFTFIRVGCVSVCPADIRISFERGNHGDHLPFGPLGKPNPGGVAHGFHAPDGRLHFNAYGRWSTKGAKDAYDVKTMALHELGHVFGLEHSHVEEAVMYHKLVAGEVKKLHADDIHGIKTLYDIK